jgi:hypothetical protein
VLYLDSAIVRNLQLLPELAPSPPHYPVYLTDKWLAELVNDTSVFAARSMKRSLAEKTSFRVFKEWIVSQLEAKFSSNEPPAPSLWVHKQLRIVMRNYPNVGRVWDDLSRFSSLFSLSVSPRVYLFSVSSCSFTITQSKSESRSGITLASQDSQS